MSVTFADVASGIAAVASIGALGTSVWVARYQGRSAEHLERVKWARSAIQDEFVHVLTVLGSSDIAVVSFSEGIDSEGLDARVAAIKEVAGTVVPMLTHLEMVAPKSLSNAAVLVKQSIAQIVASESDTEETPQPDLFRDAINIGSCLGAVVGFRQVGRATFGLDP